MNLANARVLDKATPNQAGTYDRHDVATICLNFTLPPGPVDITLRIDGIRPTTLPSLPERLRAAAVKTDREFWKWRAR